MAASAVMTAVVALTVMMAVMAAVVIFSVMMAMVVTLGVRIELQTALRQCLCCCIRRAVHAAVERDARFRKRVARAHAACAAFRKPASAPCPLPFVSTICSVTIFPSATS